MAFESGKILKLSGKLSLVKRIKYIKKLKITSVNVKVSCHMMEAMELWMGARNKVKAPAYALAASNLTLTPVPALTQPPVIKGR